MTLTVHTDLLQGSEEWLAARCGMVTASTVGRLITTRARSAIEYWCRECLVEAGSVCVSIRDGKPIKTLHSARTDAARADDSPPELVVADTEDSRGLTALLVAERITGESDPVFVSDDMMRGTLHEPIARDKYAEVCGVEVTEVGFMVRTEKGWTLGASPDGLVGDDGGLEIKCPRAKTHIRTILAGQIPTHHMAQVQASLLVSGRQWWDFVSFCAGLPIWIVRVLPDPRWFDAITDAVTQFEQTATEMVAAYEAATRGLPATERVEMDMVI